MSSSSLHEEVMLICSFHFTSRQYKCFPSKRFLSEEVMASCLRQLNIATGTPPVTTPQLNIRTVASCHTSMDQTSTTDDSSLTRGTSSADYTNIDSQRNNIPPSVSPVADYLKPCQEISSVMAPTSLLSGSSNGVRLKKKLLPHHLTSVQIE